MISLTYLVAPVRQSVFPQLHTERLILDQMQASDAEAIFAIFSDPDVTQHYDVKRFEDIQEAMDLIRYFNERFRTDTGIRWAIRDADSGQLVGSCGFNTWNPYDYSALLGYDLAKPYWGKGYAREAVAKILDYIFAEAFHFHVHRVEALILPQNRPSVKLVQSLGFEFEGLLRGKVYWNQDFHDMGMHSLIRRDWAHHQNS